MQTKLIENYLVKKNLTQRQFAKEVGCSTAFINSILNGKNTDIKISLVRKLAKQTKIAESKLIDELLSMKGKSGHESRRTR